MHKNQFVIVPRDDYAILRKYLTGSSARVFVSEDTLASFPVNIRAEARRLAQASDELDYDFGGEPDVVVDFLESRDDYAYGMLLEHLEEEDYE